MTADSPRSIRFGLVPRIALALALVGLVPLGVLTLGLFDANREALRDQVKRSHAIAVRATARQLESYLETRLELAQSLASNPLLLQAPRSGESQQVLAATLGAGSGLAAIIVRDVLGAEVVRVQWPEVAATVERALEVASGERVELIELDGERWLCFSVGLEGVGGSLLLLDEAQALVGLLTAEELGRQADLLVVDAVGKPLASSRPGVELPSAVTSLAVSRKVFGAQAVSDDGTALVAAFWPLESAPWTVVSLQPATVAEALVARLRRRSELAVGAAVLLALMVFGLAYRALVRPIRGILEAQRSLSGLPPGGGGDELSQLEASFEELRERMRRKEELGRVFLGRYQIIEILGEGGMGSVFRGWDPKLKRPVAIKTIHLGSPRPENERQALASSLLEEAVAAAGFNHPNIVAVYDAADTSDAAYVAMELVDGMTLASLLWQRGFLDQSEAIPMASAVARALEVSHAGGLVHRDVKPANVLLGHDGAIKVTDFGIATFLTGLRSEADLVFGTPGYIAPEVARGGAWEPASDLFSLGVLLYECLAGRSPFEGDTTRQVLVNTVVKQPPPLHEVRTAVNRAVADLCARLMAKNAGDRPSSAAEVADALEGMEREEGWRWSYPPEGEEGKVVRRGTGSPTVWLPTIAKNIEGRAPSTEGSTTLFSHDLHPPPD